VCSREIRCRQLLYDRIAEFLATSVEVYDCGGSEPAPRLPKTELWAALTLPRRVALSALAVELLPKIEPKPDPLGADLGKVASFAFLR
jgi:hypothetical protein